MNAFNYFTQERRASGDLKHINFVDSAHLIGKEWRELSPSQKQVRFVEGARSALICDNKRD